MKNQNSVNIIMNRSKVLRNYSQSINFLFKQKQINKNKNVLFESFKDGFVTGLSEDYIKVHVKADKSLLNNVVATKLIEFSLNSIKTIVFTEELPMNLKIIKNCMTPHSSNQNRSPFPRRKLILSNR